MLGPDLDGVPHRWPGHHAPAAAAFNDELEGEVLGVDACGRLIVNVDGVEMFFSTGDVVHVRPQLGATT